MDYLYKTEKLVILVILLNIIVFIIVPCGSRSKAEASSKNTCFYMKCVFASELSYSDVMKIGFTAPFNKIFIEKPFNFKGEITEKPSIYMAKNEYEGIQMVIFPLTELNNISVTLDNLKHKNNKITISSKDININVVGYVKLSETEVNKSRKGWHPDPLLSNQKLQLQTDIPQPLLITIRTSKETIPGEYRGIINIKNNGIIIKKLQLTVFVWDFTLPKVSKFKTASFSSWNRIQEAWPVSLGYEKLTYEKQKILYKNLADMGFRNRLPPVGFMANGLDSSNYDETGHTEVTYPTHDINKSGKKIFNQKRTDEMIDYMLDHGANHFFIAFTSDIYKYRKSQDGREAVLVSYLRDYTDHLRSRGLLEMAYVYNIDEPWGEEVDNAKKIYILIKKQVGEDVRIMQNTNQNNNKIIGQLMGYYDALDLNLGFYEITNAASYRKKYVDNLSDLWWNVNLWPKTRPNLFVEFPLVDARILGLLSYKYHINGFEYWDYFYFRRIKNYHPIKENELRLDWIIKRSLDGALIYPGENYKIYSSLRFENYRDGMEDQEYLYLLEKIMPDNKLLSIPIIKNIHNYSQNQQELMAFRKELGQILHAKYKK